MTDIEYENDLEKIVILRHTPLGANKVPVNDICIDFYFVGSTEPFTSDDFDIGDETREKLEEIEAAIIGYFS
jgi:hypothetical protein